MQIISLVGAVRTKVQRLRDQHSTVDEAENFYGLDLNAYLAEAPADFSVTDESLNTSSTFLQGLSSLRTNQLQDILLECLKCIPLHVVMSLISSTFSTDCIVASIDSLCNSLSVQPNITGTILSLLDKLVSRFYATKGYHSTAKPISLTLSAMDTLRAAEKSPDLVTKFARTISEKRPDSGDSLMPLHRMPFSLIEFQIEFFTASYVNQVAG